MTTRARSWRAAAPFAAAVATFGGASVYYACAVYDTSLLLPVEAGADTSPPPVDAGVDVDPCDHARPPPRPEHDDDGGVATGDLVFAARELVFDVDGGPGETVGYDLDGFCTCPGASSCNNPSAQSLCDDKRGRDNAAGILLANFSGYADAFNPQKINQRLQAGRIGIVIRVLDYNGTPNDTQVQLSLFLSNGTLGAETDAGVPAIPKYDGNDVWTIDPKSLVGGTAPPYIPSPDSADTTGYVKDGIAVAALNAVFIDFSGGAGTSQLRADLVGVIVTAQLAPNATGGFDLKNATLTGRWPTRKLLTSFAALHDPLAPSTYLCGDSGTYAGLKSLTCNARDITSAAQNDGQNARCDALSFAVRLNATPAKLGPVYGGIPPIAPCGVQWADDCP